MEQEKIVNLRMYKSQLDRLKKVVRREGEKYTSRSHFLRCAVERLLREEEGEA